MECRVVDSINFKVISRKVKNLERILHTVTYAVLADYRNAASMWAYKTIKGPLFLVEEKCQQMKIVVLNQS
jgi:hypothetical protein